MNADEVHAQNSLPPRYALGSAMLAGVLVCVTLLITRPAGASPDRPARIAAATVRIPGHGAHHAGLLPHLRSPGTGHHRTCPPHPTPTHKPPPSSTPKPPAPKPPAPKPRTSHPAPPAASLKPAPAAAPRSVRSARVVASRNHRAGAHPVVAAATHNRVHVMRSSYTGAVARSDGSGTLASARIGQRVTAVTRRPSTTRPATPAAAAIAPAQGAVAARPDTSLPRSRADAMEPAARSAPLGVRQPWLLAIVAIAALAVVSAACANTVVRRRRG
jgi:outer membrane biosynthesis protein TonB